MTITLDLSDEEVERLAIAVWFQDEGPVPEGWQSAAMESVRDKVERAIFFAKHGVHKVG